MTIKYKKIIDICDLQRGSSPRPKGDPRFFGGNIPRLTIKDVTRDGKYVTPCLDFLTEEGSKFGRFTKKGNLTMSISGTVGSLSFLNVDASVHDGFVIFSEIAPDYNKYFLYYYLKNYDYKSLILDGGIFKNLTTDIIKNIEIPIIPISKQVKIVTELDKQVSQIEKIKLLLEKIEIRNQYYADKLTSGQLKLNNEVSIINDTFENIINEHKKSKVMAGDSLKEGLYPFFNCSKKQTLFSNDYLIDDSVLLLSTGGTAAVNYYNGKLSYSTDVWCITSKYTKYLYYFYNANINKVEQCFQGGGLKHLSKKDFKKIEITIPNNDKDIQDIVEYLDKLSNEKEKVEKLLKLEEQRFEWLSDKLLSGEYIIED